MRIYRGNLKGESVVEATLWSLMEGSYRTSGFFRSLPGQMILLNMRCLSFMGSNHAGIIAYQLSCGESHGNVASICDGAIWLQPHGINTGVENLRNLTPHFEFLEINRKPDKIIFNAKWWYAVNNNQGCIKVFLSISLSG